MSFEDAKSSGYNLRSADLLQSKSSAISCLEHEDERLDELQTPTRFVNKSRHNTSQHLSILVFAVISEAFFLLTFCEVSLMCSKSSSSGHDVSISLYGPYLKLPNVRTSCFFSKIKARIRELQDWPSCLTTNRSRTSRDIGR